VDEKAEKVSARARQRSIGCRKRSEEHAISYQQWSKWARILAIVTAGLAGLGGIGAISSANAGSAFAVIGGALVVLVVLTRAVDEGLGAARTAEQHRLASVRFREVQLQYLTLAQFTPDDGDAAEEKFTQVQTQALRAETDSPLVESRAKRKREMLAKEAEAEKKAKEKIEAEEAKQDEEPEAA
jgi:hypothetical protein